MTLLFSFLKKMEEVMLTETQEKEYLGKIDRVIAMGPYSADWASLSKMTVPGWFEGAKFGIFFHWGIYSVPAHANEWYSRNMYIKDGEEWEFHRKAFGDQTKFGYKDFIPMLTAEKFDADEWAETFKNSGAKYIFQVAEHHDGFQMYKSRLSDWNAYDKGPHRDLAAELKIAMENAGIRYCASSHRAEHWFFMGHGKEFDSDIKDPMKKGDFYWPAMPESKNDELQSHPYPTKEYTDDWLLRTAEIIDRYHPELLYFDWWVQHEAFKEPLKKLAAYYYNANHAIGKEAAICYKHDAMMFGSGIVEVERGKLADAKPYHWQTDTAIAKNSWCYTDTLEYKNARQIVCMFADIISKNGNMLLNIGPKADGTIPEKDQELLAEIGTWMKRNSEAIYGSRCWRKSEEGETKEAEGQFTDNDEVAYTSSDIRFTCNGDSVYAFVLKDPESGELTIKALGDSEDENTPDFHGLIKSVSVVGFEENIPFTTDTKGLHIKMNHKPIDMPIVIRAQML